MSGKYIALASVLIVVIGGVWFAFESPPVSSTTVQAQQQATPTVVVASAPSIVAEAKVVPVQHVALQFPVTGYVAEVLVREGDTIQRGAPLARLETRALDLAIQEAEAQLSRTRADYASIREGATPQEVAAAQATLEQAQASLQQVRGTVTASDITAARARVDAARARLAQVTQGPRASARDAATAQVRQREAALQSQRDALSAAKHDAWLRMEQATNDLVQAQVAYAQAIQYRDHAAAHGTDPISGGTLNDAQKRTFADEATLSESRLRTAEQTVAQAQLAYDAARQNELTGIQAAEAELDSARAQLASTTEATDADVIAAARADVLRAEADLQQLTGAGRAGQVQSAQASVQNAQAVLEQLQADPRASALARAEAEIAAAEVALQQARFARDQVTLTAPINGTVARVSFKVGEQATPETALVVLADLSQWQIETDDLTELDAVHLNVGSPATIRFDALPDVALAGTVSQIKPIGENKQGDITYTIVVVPDTHDERLLWNMTAEVTFTPVPR